MFTYSSFFVRHSFFEKKHNKCEKSKRRNKNMAEISVLDLQNLRHLIGGYDTTHCKMTEYANQAQDPQVKQLFQDAANSAMKNKQDLMRFL